MTNDINDNIVRIWTDGACIGNPGPGGWGYVKTLGEKTVRHSGYVLGSTTNIAMEMTAVVQALRSLKRLDLPVVVHSDLEMISKGMNEWLSGWVSRGWRNAKREPISHQEIWLELKALRDARGLEAQITFKWVRGHVGCLGNEEADRLANTAASKAEALVGRSCLMPTRFDPERGLVVPIFELELGDVA